MFCFVLYHDFCCIVCVIVLCYDVLCCAVLCFAVHRVQCNERVVMRMIELGVMDGWFV